MIVLYNINNVSSSRYEKAHLIIPTSVLALFTVRLIMICLSNFKNNDVHSHYSETNDQEISEVEIISLTSDIRIY